MNIKVTEANTIKSANWNTKEYTWREFVNKCRTPKQLNISYEHLMAMDKEQKAQYKDGECFVGGYFSGERRKKQDLIARTMVTLDIETELEEPNWDIEDVYRVLDDYGRAALLYTTVSHGLDNPRCRVIFMTDREMSREEYEPVARKLADKIGMEKIDRTTFDLNRAMFYPTVCADGDFEFEEIAGPPVRVDDVLSEYSDWHDVTEWPTCVNDPLALMSRSQTRAVMAGAMQEDPRTKKGWIGDFCRAYNIIDAIEWFDLPYDVDGDRATYREGTGSMGCEIFDDARWMYSHHNTDPVSGRLVNSYDLVRICLFGDDDLSYDEMINLMLSDEKVCEEHRKSESRKFDLQNVKSSSSELQNELKSETKTWNWENDLTTKKNKAGDVVSIEKTITNFEKILENDPNLKGYLRQDNFNNQLCITGPVPWLEKKDTKIFEEKSGFVTPKYPFKDKDFDFLQSYVSANYLNLEDQKKIKTALGAVSNRHSFNDARNYFRNLPEWDGVPRLETLFIDFLGAEDNEYVRAVTRKTLVACVSRIMSSSPVKWDYCPIIKAEQGIGKSTLLSKIGMQSAGWFTDSLNSFDDRKNIAEIVQGKIIVELGEMGFMAKADVEKVKSALSATEDRVRFAYKQFAEDVPRKCVFIATSNNDTVLKDQTGNRRFLPIKCSGKNRTKSVFKDMDQEYVNKVWAEAYKIYLDGTEILYITEDIAEYAEEMQEEFRDKNPIEGVIEEFLNKDITTDWYKLELPAMQSWYNLRTNENSTESISSDRNYTKCQRDKVCVAEIWSLCLGYQLGALNGNRKASNDIANVLKNLKGWEPVKGRFGPFGNTRGFKRVQP